MTRATEFVSLFVVAAGMTVAGCATKNVTDREWSPTVSHAQAGDTGTALSRPRLGPSGRAAQVVPVGQTRIGSTCIPGCPCPCCESCCKAATAAQAEIESTSVIGEPASFEEEGARELRSGSGIRKDHHSVSGPVRLGPAAHHRPIEAPW